jgi:uncharacterized membrane protein
MSNQEMLMRTLIVGIVATAMVITLTVPVLLANGAGKAAAAGKKEKSEKKQKKGSCTCKVLPGPKIGLS